MSKGGCDKRGRNARKGHGCAAEGAEVRVINRLWIEGRGTFSSAFLLIAVRNPENLQSRYVPSYLMSGSRILLPLYAFKLGLSSRAVQ